MRAVGEGGERVQQAADLARVRLVAEHRQAEGRLGDEQVAGHQLERRRSGVGAALVVAGDDGAAARVIDHHLRAAEDVAGRRQAHACATEAQRLAIGQRLEAAGATLAEPGLHDGDGLRRGEHGAVARPRMIRVAVRDDGAIHRAQRIDVEAARLAQQAGGVGLQPRFEFGRCGHGRNIGPRAATYSLDEYWPSNCHRPGGPVVWFHIDERLSERERMR